MVTVLYCFVLVLLVPDLCFGKRRDEGSEDHLYFEAKNNKRGRVGTRWPSFDTWAVNDVKAANEKQTMSSSSPVADNIRCVDKGSIQSFTATVSLPAGFGTVPVFEDAASINPTISDECIMKQTSMGSGMFQMKVSNFLRCGVTQQKASDGKEWLAISIRFPFVGGLRTSDDEHVMIMCRPQERMVVKNHVMDYRSNLSNLPKTVFSSSPNDLETKVSIFSKRNGVGTYSEELARSAVIEVGQELQFRAVVRPGDGWRYAKLKDLTVQRISKHAKDEESGSPVNLFARKRTGSGLQVNAPASSSQTLSVSSSRKPIRKMESSNPNSAFLVLEGGCRNPIYSAIAPKHPFTDPDNNLAINFNFKAFMFQDMDDGDTLRILAKVVACQEQSDCQPGQCLDDDQVGYGRRRRREAYRIPDNETSGGVESFTRDFELQVVMPGYSKALAVNGDRSNDNRSANEPPLADNDAERDCRSVVIASSCLSIIFVLSTTLAAVVALRAKHQMSTEYWDRQ